MLGLASQRVKGWFRGSVRESSCSDPVAKSFATFAPEMLTGFSVRLWRDGDSFPTPVHAKLHFTSPYPSTTRPCKRISLYF